MDISRKPIPEPITVVEHGAPIGSDGKPVDTSKAVVLARRHQKQCEICMLLDYADPAMIWHVCEEGFKEEDDKFICNDCLEGLKDIRRMCHLKIDNPHHNTDIIKTFIPWFVKEDPNLLKKYNEESN